MAAAGIVLAFTASDDVARVSVPVTSVLITLALLESWRLDRRERQHD